MTSVWRRIQKSNKKSVKYRFTITPQELLIVCSTKWRPQTVVLTCMHRRRKVEGRVRRWESSMTDPCRGLIVWPSQTPDPLLFDTTLYFDDDSSHHYSDKEWTLLVEECTRKGKRKAIAAVNLNMALFNPETIIELKLKLRPLWPELSQCSMQILISSVLITDEEASDFDAKREISSVNYGHRSSIAGNITETDQRGNSAVDNTIVTSYSMNLNDIEREETSDEEKRIALASQNEDIHKSNGVIDLRGRFFERYYSDQDSRITSDAGKKEPVSVDSNEAKTEKPASHDAIRTVVTGYVSKKYEPKSSEPVENEAADIALHAKTIDISPELNFEKKPKELPVVKEGEDLLTWCQRVTKDYPSVKITDFTKSFRSGLAFCAIIHRYRPELVGSFSELNFTDSHTNRLENCRKALDAAALIGVEKKLDPGVTVTLPERNDIRCFLSELRMLLVDIPAVKRESNANESDYRIPSFFNLSESETSVMKELEILRRQRERDEAIDLTNIPDEDRTKFSAVVRGSQVEGRVEKEIKKNPRKLDNPFDSDSDSDGIGVCALNIPVISQSSVTTDENTGVRTNIDTVPISSTVTARHEELMRKREQIASVPSVITDSMDAAARERRHREEARRLMNDAASDGATLVLGGSAPTTAHQSPAVATTSGLLRKLSFANEETGRSCLRTLGAPHLPGYCAVPQRID
uniref:Calponin-homology (CH) domain-containing protein n=1 Tax=Setaria digitata TaxID=48799 RepID=A0A915PRZ2_9BILA